MQTALITGVTGQDGFYLSELLIKKGYRVIGLTRGGSLARTAHLRSLSPNIHIENCSLLEESAVGLLIEKYRPNEVYNFATQSFMPEHIKNPVAAAEISALSVVRLLEAIRLYSPNTRFFQASSSEMFGDARESPQNEETPLRPQNLYAISKVYGHQIVNYYREARSIFCCSGILFNHESPMRGLEFVTRRVVNAAARIRRGSYSMLPLGDLEARRDWGYAKDFVCATWMMLQQPKPDDYVISTGVTHTVRELCEIAFSHVGLDYKKFVVSDSHLYRVSESLPRVGDATKAARLLGWTPTHSFAEVIKIMVEAELSVLDESAPML